MRTKIYRPAMRAMSAWLGILIVASAAHGQTLAITRGAERDVREAPASNFTGVARVDMLFIIVIFIRVIPMPAWVVLIWWFMLQVITGLPQLNPVDPDVSMGVAVWAHIGGFVAGVVLVKLFARRKRSVTALGMTY